jgi:hypothetical protein
MKATISTISTTSEQETMMASVPTEARFVPGRLPRDRRAQRMIETMRLGVVPSTEPSAYTVGRDLELGLVAEDLDRTVSTGGEVRTFLGDYGTGKTHMLELAKHAALEKGFVTAEVVLNPDEAAPSHPKRVHRAMMRSLLYPDRPEETGLGLRPLLERGASDAGIREQFAEHVYLNPALAYTKAYLDQRGDASVGELEAAMGLLLAWLEGHPTHYTGNVDATLARALGRRGRIYSLRDYRPWARIYGYLLSGISALARASGYAGLAVFVDEAEFYALLSRENRSFARTLFKALAFAAVGEERLPFETSELEHGGYGLLKQLPPRWGDAPGLYLVVAMTPDESGLDALEMALPLDSIRELTPFGETEYTELVASVLRFYGSARPEMRLPEGLIGPLSKVVVGLVRRGIVANPRQAMKFAIEFLDIAYFRPEMVGRVINEIRDGSRAL